MKKFDYKKIGLGLMVVFVVGLAFLNFQKKNQKENEFNDKMRNEFVNDIDKYYQELQSEGSLNMYEKDQEILDKYFEWAESQRGEFLKSRFSRNDHAWGSISGCVGIECDQSAIVNYDMSKDELRGYIETLGTGTGFIRYSLLWSLEKSSDVNVNTGDSLNSENEKTATESGRYEEIDRRLHIHRIKMLKWNEELSIK